MVLIVNGMTRGFLCVGILFGSGLSNASRAVADSGGLPDDRLGQATAPLLLLSRSDVREDIELTESQATAVDLAIIDFYTATKDIDKPVDPAKLLWAKAP